MRNRKETELEKREKKILSDFPCFFRLKQNRIKLLQLLVLVQQALAWIQPEFS